MIFSKLAMKMQIIKKLIRKKVIWFQKILILEVICKRFWINPRLNKMKIKASNQV